MSIGILKDAAERRDKIDAVLDSLYGDDVLCGFSLDEIFNARPAMAVRDVLKKHLTEARDYCTMTIKHAAKEIAGEE